MVSSTFGINDVYAKYDQSSNYTKVCNGGGYLSSVGFKLEYKPMNFVIETLDSGLNQLLYIPYTLAHQCSTECGFLFKNSCALYHCYHVFE